MAHTKAQGATKTNRDSIAKRLGIKVYGGSRVMPGNIIVRQRGTKFFPGQGVKLGKDFTIFATKHGVVKFRKLFGRTFVNVV